VKKHPVKMEKIPSNSPARVLLEKEPRYAGPESHFFLSRVITYPLTHLSSFEANFTSHPLTITQSSKVKLVRYQQNPTPHWGPATKAESGIKRKRPDKDE
jgi:tRNA (guanine26-N2/guanine27-N2)-dimethyltransferase